MSDEAIRLLCGAQPWIAADEWRRRTGTEGRVLLPTRRDTAAATLAALAEQTPRRPLTVLRDVADALHAAGLLGRASIDHEDLLNALQYLSPRRNATLRQRIVAGRMTAAKELLDEYAWALWRSTHPAHIATWINQIVYLNHHAPDSPERQAVVDDQDRMRDRVIAARRIRAER